MEVAGLFTFLQSIILHLHFFLANAQRCWDRPREVMNPSTGIDYLQIQI